MMKWLLIIALCFPAIIAFSQTENDTVKPAEFRGGSQAWKNFIAQNLQYPKQAEKINLQGVVTIQFAVSKTGELSNFSIISSPHESFSKEAIRLLKLSPNWLPGTQLNQSINSQQVLEIVFKLASNSQNTPGLTMLLVNKDLEPEQVFSKAIYSCHIWPENNVWHAKYFTQKDNTLYQELFYKDKERKIKQGLSLTFYPDKTLADSGYYEDGKREGTFSSWYSNGVRSSLSHYEKDVLIDTSFQWNWENKLTLKTITDNNGNGKAIGFWEDGNLKSEGTIKGGKRDGKWTYQYADGSKAATAIFETDSLITCSCYKEKELITDKCVLEKGPEFAGGPEGWRRFLVTTLRYPKYALRNQLQGVVRVKFTVGKDGTVTNPVILSSPDESLSTEVLRLMSKSPKWQPAIEFNEPTTFRHIQGITFQIEQ